MSKFVSFLAISYHEYGHKFQEAELKAAAMLYLQSLSSEQMEFTFVDVDTDIRSRVQQVVVHVAKDYDMDMSGVETVYWHDYYDYIKLPHPRIVFESYYQRKNP